MVHCDLQSQTTFETSRKYFLSVIPKLSPMLVFPNKSVKDPVSPLRKLKSSFVFTFGKKVLIESPSAMVILNLKCKKVNPLGRAWIKVGHWTNSNQIINWSDILSGQNRAHTRLDQTIMCSLHEAVTTKSEAPQTMSAQETRCDLQRHVTHCNMLGHRLMSCRQMTLACTYFSNIIKI